MPYHFKLKLCPITYNITKAKVKHKRRKNYKQKYKKDFTTQFACIKSVKTLQNHGAERNTTTIYSNNSNNSNNNNSNNSNNSNNIQ